MRMKPILFNTDMVRAILDGRKTVTRRVVKTKHKDACGFYVTTRKSDGAFMGVYEYDENEGTWDNPLKPPYEVNDILYVRETWNEWEGGYVYKAWNEPFHQVGSYGQWRPSIHMPREAARIFLRVTGVRAERLQEIMRDPSGSNNQVVREGCKYGCDFIALWNNTIKKDQLQYYGWNANPYVWVIEFERCEKPEPEIA